MIFLTVGTQLPFDRLVRAMDDWCAAAPHCGVVGQIGEPGSKGYRPKHFDWYPFVDPEECQRRFDQASVIVAHAGMGSIITALLHSKPIVIMPRRDDLGEHRNDHQYATAKSFAGKPLVHVAMTEQELPWRIETALKSPAAKPGEGLGHFAQSSLIEAIKTSIVTAPRRRSARSLRS